MLLDGSAYHWPFLQPRGIRVCSYRQCNSSSWEPECGRLQAQRSNRLMSHKPQWLSLGQPRLRSAAHHRPGGVQDISSALGSCHHLVSHGHRSLSDGVHQTIVLWDILVHTSSLCRLLCIPGGPWIPWSCESAESGARDRILCFDTVWWLGYGPPLPTTEVSV